jgi:hypothetical protein
MEGAMNGITKQRAQEFGIEQQPGESDAAFRTRVSDELRRQGHIIEAHEAYTDALYDDPQGNAITGIVGAVAQEMLDKTYDGNAVGNDIAAGIVAQAPRYTSSDALLVLMAVLMGSDNH